MGKPSTVLRVAEALSTGPKSCREIAVALRTELHRIHSKMPGWVKGGWVVKLSPDLYGPGTKAGPISNHADLQLLLDRISEESRTLAFLADEILDNTEQYTLILLNQLQAKGAVIRVPGASGEPDVWCRPEKTVDRT